MLSLQCLCCTQCTFLSRNALVVLVLVFFKNMQISNRLYQHENGKIHCGSTLSVFKYFITKPGAFVDVMCFSFCLCGYLLQWIVIIGIRCTVVQNFDGFTW